MRTDIDWDKITCSWETDIENYNRVAGGKLVAHEETEAFIKKLDEMSLRDIIVLRKRPLRDIETLKEVKREIEDILKAVQC